MGLHPPPLHNETSGRNRTRIQSDGHGVGAPRDWNISQTISVQNVPHSDIALRCMVLIMKLRARTGWSECLARLPCFYDQVRAKK